MLLFKGSKNVRGTTQAAATNSDSQMHEAKINIMIYKHSLAKVMQISRAIVYSV